MKCKHCKEKLSIDLKEFCCVGCRLAYKLINNLNLQQYYRYCKKIYNKNPMKVHEIRNHLDYQEHVSEEKNTENLQDPHYKIHMIVDGIHCGSCVWLIENTLKKQKNVLNARINLSTKRLTIEWLGSKDYINLLVDMIFKLGYKSIPFTPDESEKESISQEHVLLKCIAVSGLGAISVMMLLFGVWAGNIDSSMSYYMRLTLHWISAIIIIPAVAYSGMPFFKSAFYALRAGSSNMDVPISIAAISATIISLQETITGSDYTYYDAAITLLFFLLIGRYLDLKVRNKARRYAQNLVLSQATSVTVIFKGNFNLIPIARAKVGDIVFVGAGEKIPVDGTVIEGESEADTSLITGETIPSTLNVGSKVIAGTINISSPIKIRITLVGENTTLAEIIRLMENAEQGKARYVELADRVAKLYTPLVSALSIITFLWWYISGNASLTQALSSAIAVLIITCPCALGLAVPIAMVIANSNLMNRGIIVKTRNALEKLSSIDYIVFDKTGTLTLGRPKLINDDLVDVKKLEIVKSLSNYSNHPLCKAIAEKNNPLEFDSKITEIRGAGIKASLNKTELILGNRSLCGVGIDNNDAKLEMWFKYGNDKPIRLEFEDRLREDSYTVVKIFKKMGFDIEIISGDRPKAVEKVAIELDITSFKALFSPKEKFRYLEDLSLKGKKVLMVGDGLNDSAALKSAFVSMSPGQALEITQTASDMVFQGDKLFPIVESYRIARFSNRLIKQNLTLSLAYNVITVPIAMMGLATPIIAAIIMSSSSIVVVMNSLRLIRTRNIKIHT
jgi:P-type Cu2+ transporter